MSARKARTEAAAVGAAPVDSEEKDVKIPVEAVDDTEANEAEAAEAAENQVEDSNKEATMTEDEMVEAAIRAGEEAADNDFKLKFEQAQKELADVRNELDAAAEAQKAAEDKAKDATERTARLQADWENFRRRTANERIAERERATEKLVTALLPVVDDIERAIDHARSQELHVEVLKKYYANMFALAQKCIDKLGMKMEFTNMGGGIGVAYSTENDTDLDTAALGAESAAMLAELRQKLGGVRVIIETGRYAVCTAGYYVTRVVDVKESYGTKFVMVQSTLNGFIRPSLARLIAAYLPEGAVAKGNEPLFTKMDAFDFELLTDETASEKVNLVGNLCTGTDIMAAGITLPKAKVGDILAITKAGSYAYVLTPVQFSSQPAPGQFLLCADGSMIAE